ncbi:diguanylate cyclase [Chitinivibrio alkaliphilus]|nr:diguanylate cyclase [Chitinivibrio alkaliphilus]
MDYILIVERDEQTATEIAQLIGTRFACPVAWFSSLEEAGEFACAHPIEVLLLDISFSLDNYGPFGDIPVIPVTHGIPLTTRAMLRASCLLDSLRDYSPHNRAYLLTLIEQLPYRRSLSVAVIHTSSALEQLIYGRLESLGVSPFFLKKLPKKMTVFRTHPVHMVFLDGAYRDAGVQFLQGLRHEFHKLELHVIVLLEEGYSHGDALIWLHAGANRCVEKSISGSQALELFTLQVNNAIQQQISYLEMQYMAKRDALTGAYNRRYFMEVGESLYANYTRGNLKIAVAMLDIDDFKQINDTYGHPVGDKVICALYETCVSLLRRNDLVARFGGEEFCLLLTGDSMAHASEVLERLRMAVERTIIPLSGGDSVTYTISLGLCCEDCGSLGEMIQSADRLLYQAKKSGKNCLISSG